VSIDFRFSQLRISGFRGVRELTVDLPPDLPTFVVGPNNAGKSTLINAFALALKGGGYHTFSPTATDFFHDSGGNVATDFQIELRFSESGGVLPAVQGVGNPTYVHGIRVLGRTQDGRMVHRHVLLDVEDKAIVNSPRTALKGPAKAEFKDHGLGWAQYYARIDDIRQHLPDVWLLSPENLDRSLYHWQTGPLNRLAKILSEQFLSTEWTFEYHGQERPMPSSLEAAHKFFQACVHEFPFWKDELRPRLEEALGTYLGSSAQLGLQPDILLLEEWLQQQLAVSLAAGSGGPLIPLPNMGSGWQALVRLAALDVLQQYSTASNPRVVLLCEEPEAYLHPHLRRKLRRVLAGLARQSWHVIAATHASEFISFNEPQFILRLWRTDADTARGHLLTSQLDEGAKFQAKLDERGNHELVLSSRIIVCEGKDDVFALVLVFGLLGIDVDSIGASILDVGGCLNSPSYARLAASLGIPWCALTDEDRLPDGTIRPATQRARDALAAELSENDLAPIWPVSLEATLGLTSKATPDWQRDNLADKGLSEMEALYPDFIKTVREIAEWMSE
jgi:hypothetical protein